MSIKVKSLVSLTIPIFELLLITIVGNIDTIIRHYSDKAVGAVGGISQVLNIQNVIFGFINLATSILCAQFIGARNKSRVQEVITVSLIVNLLLGILLGSVYFIFWRFILEKIQLPSELLVGIGKLYFPIGRRTLCISGCYIDLWSCYEEPGKSKADVVCKYWS